MIGLSLAWELSQREVTCTVIDQGDIGKEASWAGAGILPPANSDTARHPLDELAAEAHRLHPLWANKLKEETGIDNGYRPCGGLYLASTAGEVASLAALKGYYDEREIAFHSLDLAELAKCETALQPAIDSGRIRSAWRAPGESQIRNPAHLKALIEVCSKNGVTLLASTQAQEFVEQGDRIVGVKTNGGIQQADTICITAGAWSTKLLSQLNSTNGIMPVRGEMVLYRLPQPIFSHVLNEGPRYVVPRTDGRVLCGSSEDEVGFDKSTTRQGIAELKQLAESLLPQLKDAVVENTWAGLRPGSFDGFPYMGRVPGFSNVFAAAGHFRSGLHMSPAVAVSLSDLICGEEPTISLNAFAVGRG